MSMLAFTNERTNAGWAAGCVLVFGGYPGRLRFWGPLNETGCLDASRGVT
jgi:hypothetical protein